MSAKTVMMVAVIMRVFVIMRVPVVVGMTGMFVGGRIHAV